MPILASKANVEPARIWRYFFAHIGAAHKSCYVLYP
jgi:hypothetical protein